MTDSAPSRIGSSAAVRNAAQPARAENMMRRVPRGGGEAVAFEGKGDGVTDGTRTRNNQNHNLGIYH